ncbi:MAG: serine/threonine-protein kinase [Planctomycetota bacterium]
MSLPSSSSSPTHGRCPGCRRELPPDRPGLLCPYCLLEAEPITDELAQSNATRPLPFQLPDLTELQQHFRGLEFDSIIGHGGMGAVFRARQVSLARDVAVKVLPPEVAASPGFTNRFVREAQALARLSHPNVVNIYEHGTAGPYAYLMMELVEGINLRQLMAKEKLPPTEALHIVTQLCDALKYAHDRGVVHRDIKPENILVGEDGDIKITDFGLAKLIAPDQPQHTRTQQVMGTVHYMAPEQIERPENVDHRADLYSLGVVFYELLTGELPLGRFELPSRRAGTEKRLDRVVERSLEKEPDRRYESAGQIRDELDRPGGFNAGRHLADAAEFVGRQLDVDGWKQSTLNRWSSTQITLGGIASFVAVAAFYLLAFVLVVIGTDARRDEEFLISLTVFPAIIWGASWGVARLLFVAPLPPWLAWAAAPIRFLHSLPTMALGWLRRLTSTNPQLRYAWLTASWFALIAGLILFWIGVAEEDDLIPFALCCAPIAWFSARIAMKDKFRCQTSRDWLVVLPPLLVFILPITIFALVWPVIVWSAIAQSEPQWLDWLIGVDSAGPFTMDQWSVARRRIASCALCESLWLTALAAVVATQPMIPRWCLRPTLDRWEGEGRWLILIGGVLVSGIALAALR